MITHPCISLLAEVVMSTEEIVRLKNAITDLDHASGHNGTCDIARVWQL